MELERRIDHFNCYQTLLDTTIFQEETLESIVPDACPDILRILDTEAVALLQSKQTQAGRGEVTGVVRASVLYLPDGCAGPRRMCVTLPFTASFEHAQLGTSSVCVAVPRVLSADSRVLNPRKVLVRVTVGVALEVFTPQDGGCCCGVTAPSEAGIEQQFETETPYLTVAVTEKPFTFSDELHLSPARPSAEEILKTRADIHCGEAKLIGGKLVVKGNVSLQLVYRSTEGGVLGANFELPFSQILSAGEAGEMADMSIEVILTACDCTLLGDDGRSLSVSLAFLAQAMLRETRTVTLLSDLYSTACPLTVQRSPLPVECLSEHWEHQVPLREQLETVSPVKNVLDAYLTLGEVTTTRQGLEITLTAGVTAVLLYEAEDGGLETLRRTLQVQHTVPMAEGCTLHTQCSCDEACTAAPVGDGAELRATISFQLCACISHRSASISEVQLDETSPRSAENQPSIILRMVGAGERLWDIAKSYGTTMDEIVQANLLEDDTLPAGQLLLIPKKR